MRYGKKAMPFLSETNKTFEFGKGRIVREGDDLAIIATGETVYPAWLAAKKLEDEHGVKPTLVSMHTIKPLDTDLLDKLAANGRPIVTVEEHMINGGLGEACASYLFQKGVKNKFKIVGIPDEYTVTGSQIEIFNHYGISKKGLYDTCKDLLDI
jgi:transketolase